MWLVEKSHTSVRDENGRWQKFRKFNSIHDENHPTKDNTWNLYFLSCFQALNHINPWTILIPVCHTHDLCKEKTHHLKCGMLCRKSKTLNNVMLMLCKEKKQLYMMYRVCLLSKEKSQLYTVYHVWMLSKENIWPLRSVKGEITT